MVYGSRVYNKVCKSRRQKLWSRQVIDDESKVTCNAGVFWGWANAIAAILDFKRRERLARVERATKGEGISLPTILQIQHGGYDNRDFGTHASPRKRLHCRLTAKKARDRATWRTGNEECNAVPDRSGWKQMGFFLGLLNHMAWSSVVTVNRYLMHFAADTNVSKIKERRCCQAAGE